MECNVAFIQQQLPMSIILLTVTHVRQQQKGNMVAFSWQQ